MAKSKSQADAPVRVDATRDADRLVVLTPEDEDRFVRSCRWVVEASKLGLSRDVWLRELHALLSHVRRWAERHSAKVLRCLAVQRDDQIAIFVVPRSGRYDFDLSDHLTELDLELAEKFRACPCDVLQMPDKPWQEIQSSAGTWLSILIYDDGGRA